MEPEEGILRKEEDGRKETLKQWEERRSQGASLLEMPQDMGGNDGSFHKRERSQFLLEGCQLPFH